MTATTMERQSRVGKRPIALPSGVTVSLANGKAQVKGPKGSLELDFPAGIQCAIESNSAVVTSDAGGSDGARLQGLGRSLLANMVHGVTEGYALTLELHGTGYRAELKGTDLHLALGLSHPVVYPLPKGVNADVPKDSKGTVVNLTSMDKQAIGQAGATIRSFRPPEPYGGKGVRYRGENIRRKAGKAGKK